MVRWIVVALAIGVAAPASAQVQIDLGFSAPPTLVAVPEVAAVQYVPTASANVFFYGGQYWVFNDNGWYYGSSYNGPWVFASPEYVPQPLLIVPVTYYRRPPPAWRGWHGGQPPQWGVTYGRSWQGRREVFVPVHGQQPVHAYQQPVHQQPAHAAPPPQQHAEMRPPAAHEGMEPHGAPPPHAENRPPQAHPEPAPHAAPPAHEPEPQHGGEEHH